MKMMEMRVGAIGIDKDSGQSLILLRDMDNKRALPIWVGLAEVRAISMAVRNVISPRPSTHDLLFTTIKQLGCAIKEVRIAAIKGDTYIAEIILRKLDDEEGRKTITLDARPSDAIALAAMCDAPVLVSDDIISRDGVSANPEKEQQDAAEFKDFVDNLKASDFTYAGNIELPGDDFEID